MRLYAIIISGYNPELDKVLILYREKKMDFFSYFQRGSVFDAMKFLATDALRVYIQNDDMNDLTQTIRFQDQFNAYMMVDQKAAVAAMAICD